MDPAKQRVLIEVLLKIVRADGTPLGNQQLRQQVTEAAGGAGDWKKRKPDIRTELDKSKFDNFHGTVSLSLEAGDKTEGLSR